MLKSKVWLLILCLCLCLCLLKRGSCEFERREEEEEEEEEVEVEVEESIILIYNHHHTLKTSSLLPSTSCTTTTQTKPKGLKGKSASILKVINRHGPCSHLDQHLPTISEILSQDQHRVQYLRSRISVQPKLKNAFTDSRKVKIMAKSGASLGSGNYVVTVGLGTPKRDLSLIFDTGSDLTWTQCQPCVKSCYNQQEPTFNPSLSATYLNITCTSPLCSDLSTATGNNPGCAGSTCVYGIKYGDQSFSVGFFGKDKLTLSNTDVLDGFLFGCGQNNQGLFGKTAGLIGLGRDKLSLVSQSAQKYGKFFSYCLPPSSSSLGYLTLGKNGISQNVKYTPFATGARSSSFYFVTILDMYVGGTKLSISPSVFSKGGSIIDSGTVITRLPPDAYSVLSAAFAKGMVNYTKAPGVSILDTCYDLSNYTTVQIPTVSFLFGGNVKVDLDSLGIVYAVSASKVCLAFAANGDPSDVGILGNVQQKNMQVVYDLAGGKLGFAPDGCS